MEVYKVTDSSWDGGDYEGSREVMYSSYEEAKKFFDDYKKNNIYDNEFFKRHAKEYDDTVEYNDGGRWSYELSLRKINLDVKEKYSPEDRMR